MINCTLVDIGKLLNVVTNVVTSAGKNFPTVEQSVEPQLVAEGDTSATGKIFPTLEQSVEPQLVAHGDIWMSSQMSSLQLEIFFLTVEQSVEPQLVAEGDTSATC